MTSQPLYRLRKQWQRTALTLLIVLFFCASVHAGFEECPQFFAQGKPPVVQPKPMQRELCYSAFAILHSGVTKTPVFVADAAEIGRGRVKVPLYIYKLVYDEETSRAWAHWHENRSGKQNAKPISYQELVERTGINFLPAGQTK